MCSMLGQLAPPPSVRQTSLLAGGPPVRPERVGPLDRIDLGQGAWIDTKSAWLGGADAWLDELKESLQWRAAKRQMYDRVVVVPRLMAHFDRRTAGATTTTSVPDSFEGLATIFEQHYRRPFPTVGCNWYRDGNDSVAWHADKVKRPTDSIVAIVGVGERRPFLVKPSRGGTARKWLMGDGDLIVLGGSIQASWQHAVPKVASSGERISIMIRSGDHLR